MPGQKEAYRLYSSDGHALIDLLQMPEEGPPQVSLDNLIISPIFWYLVSSVILTSLTSRRFSPNAQGGHRDKGLLNMLKRVLQML